MVKIEDKTKIQRRNYYSDWDFFTLWKVGDSRFYRENDYIRIADVEEQSDNEYVFLRKINRFLTSIGVRTDIIRKFSDSNLDMGSVARSMFDANEEDEQVKKSFNRVKRNKFSLIDIINLWEYIEYLDSKFYLYLKFDEAEKEQIKDYLDKYIDDYINHELLVVRNSFFIFEKQKEWFIKKIQAMKAIENFGNNFVISKKSSGDPEVLFFHTLYALEKIGYIDIINIWFVPGVLDRTEKTYSANIIVNEDFIVEINQEFKKTNPEKYIEKFDSKTGILSFGSKKIELSKKGKETDAVLLMSTLLKEEEGEWVHNDEILEDWGYSLEEQAKTPKNKVYFALQKINKIMELEAQIENFIEGATTKARINPKYRQIDK